MNPLAQYDPHPQVRGALSLKKQSRMERYRIESHERLCELIAERDQQIENLKHSSDGLVKWVVVTGAVAIIACGALLGQVHFHP